MSEKEFMNRFMISNVFEHKYYGKVRILGIPTSNGDVNAFIISECREVTINIKELVQELTKINYVDNKKEKKVGNSYV